MKSETLQTTASHHNDSMFQGLCLLSAPIPTYCNVYFMFALRAVMTAQFIFGGKTSENILNSLGYDADRLLKMNTNIFFMQLFPCCW